LGVVTFGAKTTNFHQVDPRFFFVILEAIWTSETHAKLEKNHGRLQGESRGQSWKTPNFRKKFPKNWGERGGRPVL